MAATGTSAIKLRQSRNHQKFYAAYTARQQDQINKARRIMQHLRRHPNSTHHLTRLRGMATIPRKKALEKLGGWTKEYREEFMSI